jgi:hypothetical protein
VTEFEVIGIVIGAVWFGVIAAWALVAHAHE